MAEHESDSFFKKVCKKCQFEKPITIADAGLLSKENIKALEEKEYEYILGTRLKNENV